MFEPVQLNTGSATITMTSNPTFFETETTEQYHTDCIENAPDDYHLHVETQE